MILPRVDVAYVLLYNEHRSEVLLVKNEEFWSLPGGKREVGETLQQAAIREAKEETGYDVGVDGVVHLSEKFTDREHVMFITFHGCIIGGQPETTDVEIQEISWKLVSEAEQLLPYHSDILSLLTSRAQYTVE